MVSHLHKFAVDTTVFTESVLASENLAPRTNDVSDLLLTSVPRSGWCISAHMDLEPSTCSPLILANMP